MNCDHDLFLALNFDGGPMLDRAMLAVSGTLLWIPLYLLIVWLVWRRTGARGLALFLLLTAAAVGLSDMVAGIFKHNGPLGGLLPDFAPRWRPMFTPSLEGLDIAPDSLRALRRMTPEALAAAGYDPAGWNVHVPVEAVSGRYGTVSAHAATMTALAVLSIPTVRRAWFTALMIAATAAICYSRIYLGYHFPFDILLGAATGAVTGGAALAAMRAAAKRVIATSRRRASSAKTKS